VPPWLRNICCKISHHPLKYTNRKKDDHYFRAVTTAKGGTRYYITKNNLEKYDDLLTEMPSGFEIVETPEEGRVIFRKIKPEKITEEERLIVEDGIRELSALNDFIVYIDDKLLTVYYSQFNYIQGVEENISAEKAAEMWDDYMYRWKRYSEGFYFRLVDEKKTYF
jgi:hypothetical protein